MAKYIIEGNAKLEGSIRVAGNKNAALPIIAATILTDEPCTLENVPNIRDVQTMLTLLTDLGKQIDYLDHSQIKISGTVLRTTLNSELARDLRASVLFMGSLLARVGQVSMAPPGGCIIGRRNVDTHFEVLNYLGANVEIRDKDYYAQLDKKQPANIFLNEASVTATENALLLAASIEGQTTIQNAACEPHVTDLVDVLNKMGAMIQGSDTNRLIIHGTNNLKGFRHRIRPDHIEAGTFAITAACCNGFLTIEDALKNDMISILRSFQQLGVKYEITDESTLCIYPSVLNSENVKIRVGLWPGFPTDLLSPLIVLATQARGTTLCHDWMYESRMFFVDKLIAMGAQIIQCDPHRVLVSGPSKLRGQELSSPDIRAGIALVVAALSANGQSIINHAELIDRGYENIAERLGKVGAQIRRED